jgi:NADP-dependent 3-hydroxy acid dehydrogenase YdfG
MNGKKVVITGGSSGLGAALARKLTAMGAQVIILARDKARLAAAASNIGCDCAVCDVRELESCQAAHRQIADKYGDIDILINNAGIWTDNNLEIENPTRAKDAIETNLLGAIYVTNCFLPRMREANHGAIFFTNSVSGRFPIVDSEAGTYSASKWGLRGYAGCARRPCPSRWLQICLYRIRTDVFVLFLSLWISGIPSASRPWMTSVENIANAAVFTLTATDDINISSVVIEKTGEAF